MLWQYFSIFQWLLVVQYQTNIYLCVFWGLTSFNHLIFFLQFIFAYLRFVTTLLFSCSVMPDSLPPHGPHAGPSLAFTISWILLKLMSIEWVMPSNHLVLCRPLYPLLVLPSTFPASGSFPVSRLFASGGQSIGVSASASVLPMNIQGWYPLGLTGLISLLSKGLSKVFSSTTVWKRQFFRAQAFLWSNSHIHTWLLEKPCFDCMDLCRYIVQILLTTSNSCAIICPCTISFQVFSLNAYCSSVKWRSVTIPIFLVRKQRLLEVKPLVQGYTDCLCCVFHLASRWPSRSLSTVLFHSHARCFSD